MTDAAFLDGIGLMVLFFFTSLYGMFKLGIDPVALWFGQMAVAILICSAVWGWA